MARNKPENKITPIKPGFDSVLVCNDRKLRPYIEIIIQEPENITHQNLGTLIGVLEVTDASEDSSYIVNYLVSVIKKEYFSRPKRGPIESLESALHKANLALSGLAEHGNVGWLGKLNALIAVTVKNSLHLSQAGTASALLLRSKILTDVSEGLASDEIEPHPLKTFVSVSSGRLEKDDKLIITTDSLFDIFSREEIKKSSLRFSDEEFVRFLKTALSNELPRAAILIASLKNQEEVSKEVPKRSEGKNLNAFSSDAFNKKSASRQNGHQELTSEIKKELQKSSREFTDKKTGHIYIKEDLGAPGSENANVSRLGLIFENLTETLKNIIGMFIGIAWKKLKNFRLPRFPRPESESSAAQPDSQPVLEKTERPPEKIWTNLLLSAKRSLAKIISLADTAFSQKNRDAVLELGKNIRQKLLSGLRLAAPSLEKIKVSVRRMDYQQRLYAALAIILILVVPLIGLKIKDRFTREEPAPVATEAAPATVPLAQDKNVIRVGAPVPVYSGDGILEVLALKDKAFAITKTGITDVENGKTSPLPQDFRTPKYATGMRDLNLIFLLDDDGRMVSFSPISSAFQNNDLAVPADADIRAIGTYLTYIYLVDAKNNQIYRYPRAEGGFGASSNWLKDSVNLSDAASMAISDNIFISAKNGISKLFRGKTQEFSPEKTATPIAIASLAISEEGGDLFILDKQNSRVVRLGSDNAIIAQYHTPEMGSADSIAVDSQSKKIYLSNEKTISALAIE